MCIIWSCIIISNLTVILFILIKEFLNKNPFKKLPKK